MPQTTSRGPRRGLYWQDWYAAWLLLRFWRSPAEGIQAIKLEATDSPHIDDIIVYRPGRTTYFQLKRVQSGTFKGSALFGESHGLPLLAKLLKGWRSVSKSAKNAVEIVLATNASLSSSSQNRPLAPADFNEGFLGPLHGDQHWRPSASHQDHWQQLQEVAGARSSSEFGKFLHSLHLRPNEPSEEKLRSLVTEILQGALRPGGSVHLEAEAWVSRVYDLATEVATAHKLTRGKIDAELRKLFRTSRRRLEHILTLPENHIPRERVAQDILESAQQLENGYLLVTGPPGTGKTTLATWMADSYPEDILLRYHVFHPKRSADIERSTRATALSFVTELLEALVDRFPQAVNRYAPAKETVADAIDALWTELGRLQRDRTAIIVVDGIDHVFRANQDDGQMLFDSLRRDAPPGIVFVLFGQPGWPYPAWIKKTSTVEVPAFSAGETRLLLTTSFPWDEEDPALPPLVDTIQERTRGNPLSLFYALSSLEKFDSAREASSELGKLTIFGDQPHKEYELLLEHIEDHLAHQSKSFRQDLLAWLAVALAPITLERLISGFSDEPLSRRAGIDILVTLRPVLTESSSEEFQIFHDDFRRFAEEGLTSSTRKSAHSRHARSLSLSYQPNEVRALSEHLWFAELFEELASLPSSQKLPDWLVDGDPEQVGDLFRLSCAAALMCRSDSQIIGACLYCKLALDASPDWYEDTVSWRHPSNLKAWSFMVPPKEIDREALEKCKDALQVAAKHLVENPTLAETVVNRFTIPQALWPDTHDNDSSHDFRDYLAAWASWLLLSGRPEEVSRLLTSTEHDIGPTLNAIEELLQSETNPEVLSGWATGLIPAAAILDRRLIKAGLLHLVSGQPEAASGILKSLNRELEALGIETQRNAACLGCLLNQAPILPIHATARIRWSGGHGEDSARWREFFFDGMVDGYLSQGKEPLQFHYSAELREFVRKDRTENDSRISELCWRCGIVAGIVKRAPGLVRTVDVYSAARPFLEGAPDLPRFGNHDLSVAARVYLPLLAYAVSGSRELASSFGETLFESALKSVLSHGSRPVGVVEALWILSPERWREVAGRALSAERLPESAYYSRYQWFSYWRSRARRRGIAVPKSFDRLASISLLGVYRKTYPTSLAIELLGSSLGEADFENRLRQLVDVLIQVDKEPEGGRAAFRGLPRVLALALVSDANLFLEEFHRTTSDSPIAQPFDSTRGSTAKSVLDLETSEFTSAELVGLWHWVAASPGSDQYARVIAGSITQRLRSAGEKKSADSIESWANAIAPAQERSTESSAAEEGSSSKGSRIESPARDLSLKAITPTWFSSGWSRDENVFLKRLLAQDSENWKRILSSLARNLVDGTADAVHLELVAEAIPSLRPDLDTVEAFQAALHYVRMRSRFQGDPLERTALGESTSLSRTEALVQLTAEGLEAQGVEVVRRALRGLSAMGQHPELCASVEAEATKRLGSSSDRTVGYALAILRRLPKLSDTTLQEIQTHQSHRNAWCRWLACTAGGLSAKWSDPPILAAPPGPIGPEPLPSKRSVGASYFSDPTSIREIYVRRLKELTGFDEDFIRERFELEYRSLPRLEADSESKISPREGPGLTVQGMGFAAARAIGGFLVGAPAQAVSPMLSLAAPFDPWLALAHPYQPSRKGWIELAAVEERVEDRKTWTRLRVLCIVPTNLWRQHSNGNGSGNDIAIFALRFTVPEEPAQFAWVSEAWDIHTSAMFAARSIPVQPLAFHNQPFTELTRDRFQLVPRWDLPIGAGLRYDNSERPCWKDPENGIVIEASYEEWKGVRPGIAESPSWRTGWFTSPAWLKQALKPIAESTTLISCSRVATGGRTEDSSDEVEEVLFFAEEVKMP